MATLVDGKPVLPPPVALTRQRSRSTSPTSSRKESEFDEAKRGAWSDDEGGKVAGLDSDDDYASDTFDGELAGTEDAATPHPTLAPAPAPTHRGGEEEAKHTKPTKPKPRKVRGECWQHGPGVALTACVLSVVCLAAERCVVLTTSLTTRQPLSHHCMHHADVVCPTAERVSVFCRVRPENTQEVEAGGSTVVSFGASGREITLQSDSGASHASRFNRVFPPEVDQSTM